MKVLQVISGNDNGGGAQHILNLVKDNEIFNTHLAIIGDGEFHKRLLREDLEFYKVNTALFNGDLVQLIDKENYDIVNFHGPKAVYTYRMIKHKIKAIAVNTLHSDFRYDYFQKNYKNKLKTELYKYCLSSFKHYICVSDNLKILAQGRFKGNFYVISNGTDETLINKVSSKESVRKELGLDENEFVISICARLSEIKNHKSLITAFNEFSNLIDNVTLLIIGDGELEDELKKEAKTDKIKFLGYKKNADDYINASDINAIVSFSEGGIPPLSIIEGFFLKKSCIISNFKGIDKILSNEICYFTNPNSVENIKDTLVKVYNEKYDLIRKGELCYEDALNKFSVKIFRENYKRAYESIILSENSKR